MCRWLGRFMNSPSELASARGNQHANEHANSYFNTVGPKGWTGIERDFHGVNLPLGGCKPLRQIRNQIECLYGLGENSARSCSNRNFCPFARAFARSESPGSGWADSHEAGR